MPEQKNNITEAVRKLLRASPGVVETSRADSGASTLSFQSCSFPERHVWIDTDFGGQMVVDIEDWLASDKWDNALGSIATSDIELLTKISVAWLTGHAFAECLEVGGKLINLR